MVFFGIFKYWVVHWNGVRLCCAEADVLHWEVKCCLCNLTNVVSRCISKVTRFFRFCYAMI